MTTLIVAADDYGYAPAYDEGILEAARRGAVDAASAMVDRGDCEPEPLLETGVEIGLHLELGGLGGRDEEPHPGRDRATPAERERAHAEAWRQLVRFEELFGRPAAYLDGHHHAHARPGLGLVIARLARERSLPVRSVDPRHRRLLRCQGVPTPDLLVGRLRESDPALPAELGGVGERPAGVVEWMVHPGYPDPSAGSSYDAGRGEDLELVLGFRPPPGVRRADHRAALVGERGPRR